MSFASTTTAFARAIPLGQLAEHVPAAFGRMAAATTSPRYVFISTAKIVHGLVDAGFDVLEARYTASRKRDPAYATHLLRLQPRRQVVTLDDAIPQIVLVNSHDGRCTCQLRTALYRPVCTNGLMVSLGDFGVVQIPHRGELVDDIVEAAIRMLASFPVVGERVSAMQHTRLTRTERDMFAQDAMLLRYPGSQPITPQALLEPRRESDIGDDVWRVFNVLQENLLRGGLSATSAGGRRSRTRPVRAIREDLRINQALWQHACEWQARAEARPLTPMLSAA